MPSQAAAVATYWSQAPLGQRAYDPDDANNWPSPWELLHHNQWCRNSVAIGMENTLRLAGVDAQRLTLNLITDPLSGVLLVLIIDDTVALNYNWGCVQPLPLSDHKVIRRWRFADRGYYQLAI